MSMAFQELRPELPELPPRLKSLPVHRGYPVPWFVGYVDGEPDFRVMAPGKRERAVAENRCWLCGGYMGSYKAFVVGPMCTVNRISLEPPSHRDCALYAVKACPFLARPHAKRRTEGMPEGSGCPAGESIDRNPGVAAVWITKGYVPFRDQRGGWLIEIGTPEIVHWYAEGREATRAEVEASFDSGVPEIMAMAQEEGGVLAVERLETHIRHARRLFPEA